MTEDRRRKTEDGNLGKLKVETKNSLLFLDSDAEGSSLYEAKLRHAAYAALLIGTFSKSILVYAYILM